MRILVIALLLVASSHADERSVMPAELREARAKNYFDLGRSHFRLGQFEAAVIDFGGGTAPTSLSEPGHLMVFSATGAVLAFESFHSITECLQAGAEIVRDQCAPQVA